MYKTVCNCVHGHMLSVSLSPLALGFTHQKGLSYQIFELEDSGLPQQGILPNSARKTITMSNHRYLEKDSPHCAISLHKNFKYLDTLTYDALGNEFFQVKNCTHYTKRVSFYY